MSRDENDMEESLSNIAFELDADRDTSAISHLLTVLWKIREDLHDIAVALENPPDHLNDKS